MAEQIVALAPDESKEISFEAIPKEVKTYSVSVNGLQGSFKAMLPPVTAEIISISVSPSSITTGGSFKVTVRWRNTGSVGYAFDIVGSYGEYLKKMEYFAGAVYNILAAPGEEKITVVTVPTYKGDIGTFDVIARVGDVKENGYPFLLREYASKYLSNAITLKAVAPPPPPEPAWETSEVTTVGASLPTWCSTCWMLCSISVTNKSSSPAPCSVALHSRYFMSPDYEWTDWRELLPKNLNSYRKTVSDREAALTKYDELTMLEATLAPGETKVFSGVVPNMISKRKGMPRHWVKFVGPFGEVLAPGYFLMVEYG